MKTTKIPPPRIEVRARMEGGWIVKVVAGPKGKPLLILHERKVNTIPDLRVQLSIAAKVRDREAKRIERQS